MEDMKTIISTIVLMLAVVAANAQKVTFYSQEFEEGVRDHIGLAEGADVLQTHTDTITSIDLSGLGITDIRDVVYLSAVKKLNLSYNEISDVSSLLTLENLQSVDLSNNQIEDVNTLAFMQLDSLELDVSSNYIQDFSYFYSPTPCQFTFLGMGMQQVKDAPYFDVYQLFVDINAQGKTELFYRGYTNIESPVYLACGEAQTTVTMNGNTNSCIVPGHPAEPQVVTLTNGEKAYTTWVLPPTEIEVSSGEAVTINTGLPEDYTITSAWCKQGEVNIDATTLNYIAPDHLEEDTLYIGYYSGGQLRGFTQYYLVDPSEVSTLLGDVNNDRQITIADVTAMVNKICDKPQTVFRARNADITKDGDITIADVKALVNIILGN